MIEVIIVIAILGILAATVSVSMIGVTRAATMRAQDEERMTIQSAMNMMLMDQRLDPEAACSHYASGTVGTKDMSRFPSSAAHPPPARPSGSSSEAVQLYPHYLRKKWMTRAYVCAGGGTVTPAPGSG